MGSKSAYYCRIISEESCDTEDWSHDTEKSVLHHKSKLHSKKAYQLFQTFDRYCIWLDKFWNNRQEPSTDLFISYTCSVWVHNVSGNIAFQFSVESVLNPFLHQLLNTSRTRWLASKYKVVINWRSSEYFAKLLSKRMNTPGFSCSAYNTLDLTRVGHIYCGSAPAAVARDCGKVFTRDWIRLLYIRSQGGTTKINRI